MRVEITALGETVVNRDLLRFADHLAVPAAALEGVAVLLRRVIEEQFDTQGGRSGGWAALADSTVTEKARLGQDPRILIATGRLKESLTRKFDPDHVETLSRDSLVLGTTVTYGIYHQTGTSRMPRRPPLALSDMDRVEIVKVMQAALVANIKAAGGDTLARRSSFYRAATG